MKAPNLAARAHRKWAMTILAPLALLLGACTGQIGGTSTQTVVVVVTPPTASVQTGQTQQFTASVTGTTNTAVTWSVSSTSATAPSIGTISASGLYTAPATVPTGGTVKITATSQADTSKAASSTVTITAPAITVTVSPKTPSVQVGRTQQFTATVANTSNTAVTWQVNGTTGGNSTAGTVNTSGLYTAPAAVPTGGTVTVKAVSQADNTKSDTATVTVSSAPVISITIAPASANVQAGIGKQNFTATLTNDTGNKGVTWSISGTGCSGATCGTLTSATTTSVTYNAPASIPTPSTVTLKATSIADTTKTSSAGITVTAAVSVSIAPPTASVQTGKTQQFTATVSNATNTAVTWQVNGVTGGNSTVGTVNTSGLYTAPATVPTGGTVTVTAISQADASKSASATVTVTAPPPITVVIAPTTASVQIGLTQQFTATVTNTSNTAVTWQVSGTTGGNSTTGTITTGGLYTAPATVPTGGTVTVTAVSQADNTKSASATVTVTTAPLIVITLAPTSASVQAGIGTQNFTATLTNDTGSKGVTWSVSGTGCSGATCGTLTNVTTTSVTYNAPSSVPSPAAVTLKATSVADTTRTSTVAITVTAAVGVSVAPTTATINVTKTQNFTATVTNDAQNKGVSWTLSGTGCTGAACGTLSATTSASGAAITYTAPASAPSPATVTLKASSVADATRSASATITVAASSSTTVAIAPKRGGLTPGQTLAFSATVNGSASTAVTWEVDTFPGGNATVGTINSSGVYTAPNSGGAHNIVARSTADTTATSPASPIGVTDLAGVYTYHNDNSRTGANTQEYALTTANVNTSTFGKMFSCSVDAAIYAQPLWVANVSISGVNHNVVYVATQHDSVYAFDADSSACTNVWGGAKSLLGTGETWVSSSDQSGCSDLVPDIGIVGTPVIDPSSGTLYVVARSKNGTTFHQRLHALDLATGAEKFSGPTDITATVNGTGNGSSGGHLAFDVKIHNQRPALLLSGGHVIITWASHCDFGPYHGWMMSYGAGTLTQEAVFNVSPNGTLGGIWMAGGGPAADASGNIFLATGNGSWTGTDAFGDSILRIGPPSAGQFGSLDYFTPTNQLDLENADRDLGSGGVLLLPILSSGAHTQLLVQVGKEGKIYVADRQNLGQIFCTTSTLGNPCSATDSQLVQELPSATGNMFSTPAFWNNNVYFGGVNDDLKAYSFNQAGTGLLSNTLTSRSASGYNFPGTTPSVSAQGTTSGTAVVWAINTENNGTDGTSLAAAVLHAYDATNLATELWNSSKVAGDAAGNAVKFTVPTIANGKVYVGESGTLTVYGLKP